MKDRVKLDSDYVGRFNRIYIYGAGTIANIVWFFIEKAGLSEKVQAFLVSDEADNPFSKFGKTVVSADKIVPEGGDFCLIATQKVTHSAIVKKLNETGWKDYDCIDDEILLDEFYSDLYANPIAGNKVLFMNMNGHGYGCNPKYIAEEIIRINHDRTQPIDLVWAVWEGCDTSFFPPQIRTVVIGTYEYYYELATAKIWIDNARKHFDSRKRDGQYYVQSWHGAAPIKKVEKDVEEKLPEVYVANARRDSQMADLFLSGSEFYTELYKKSFWYDGDIMEVGLPRQDAFWHSESIRDKVCKYFCIPKDMLVILYAPTFRNDFSNRYYDLDLDLIGSAVRERFGRKCIWMVSKHPDNKRMEYEFEKRKDVLFVEKYDDFEELLVASDVLISDYSGCVYDFSFSGKPVFLYQKDYEEYIKERDFYIPMDQLPYVRAETNEELSEKIKMFDREEYDQKLQKFMGRMKNYDNGCASQKVVERLIAVIDK